MNNQLRFVICKLKSLTRVKFPNEMPVKIKIHNGLELTIQLTKR